MDKIEYLEEKVEFYRQEVERYKSMILYEKEDSKRRGFLNDELEAAEKMLEMFATITTQVLAWDVIKNSITMPVDGTFKINSIFTNHTPMVEEELKYIKIFDALQNDPEFDLKSLLLKAKPYNRMDL